MFPRLPTSTVMAAALAAVTAAGCGRARLAIPALERPAPARAHPMAPAHCDESEKPGADLRAALARLPEGGTLCLAAGDYRGPLTLSRRATIWGPPNAVIHTSGKGTTITVEAPGSALLGFGVDGSGPRYDTMDAAVHLEHADGTRLIGLEIRRAIYGVVVDLSKRVVLDGNVVHGTQERRISLRGDPIRLWETHDSTVIDNQVLAGRDVVVWYSHGNRIEHNLVRHSRYGTHLMYADGNTIIGNRYEHDVVGVFLMYSRDIRLGDNLFLADGSGSVGMGLGLKESGAIEATGNAFVGNSTACYVDTSPFEEGDYDRFSHNLFAFSDVAVTFHASEVRNAFTANTFRDNRDQVRVEGNGDATRVEWRGNYFDDYAGYDLDRDGTGDIPYELRSLSGELVQDHAELAFLRGTPALWLIDVATQVAPLLQPRTLLIDRQPAMTPPPLESPRRSATGPQASVVPVMSGREAHAY